MLKVDLPRLKKEEVKVEVEDDKVVRISGERKTRMTRGTVLSAAVASS